jgi:hypothetical protein
MKRKLFLVILPALMTGCAPAVFYQLYETKSDNIKTETNYLVYENDDLQIIFDFWGYKGDGSMRVFNKGEKYLYLDLGTSHLVRNLFALPYFRDRTFVESSSMASVASSSQTTGTASYESNQSLYISPTYASSFYRGSGYATIGSTGMTFTNVKGSAIEYKEQRIVGLPPKSFKIIEGFILVPGRYNDCNQPLYPARKEDMKTLTFTKNNSPYVFRNIISYGFDENLSDKKQVEMDFWVWTITNIPKKEFFETIHETVCGEKSFYATEIAKYSAPQRFYIHY